MPSQRYLLVEAVDGHPVSDPHNPGASPARYVGWEPKPELAADPDHALEHYQPARQVVLDHPDLQRAAASKRLRVLGSTVAKSHDAARAALLPVPAPKSAKAGDK